MTLARLSPDGDGPALFEDVEVPYTRVHAHGAETEVLPAQAIAFVRTPGDFALDFHAASRRRLILVLDGRMEIEDGRGARRLFGRGDIIDICDTSGQGHKTRVLDGREMLTALIEIGDQLRPDWPALAGDAPIPLAYTRTDAGPDGGSRFVDATLDYALDAPLGSATAPLALSGYQFVYKPPTLDHGFHHAPQRQFVLNLTSGMEVETSDGATRQIHAGGVYLGADTTGEGHKTRALDDTARLSIFAHLA